MDRFIKRLPNKKDDSKKPSTPTGTSEEIISSSGSVEASYSSKTNLESFAKNQTADNPILEANLSTPGSSKTHEEQSSSKIFKAHEQISEEIVSWPGSSQTQEGPSSAKKLELVKGTGPSTTSLRKKKTNRAPLKFVSSWLSIPDFKGWLVKSTKKKGENELGFCKVCQTNILAHKVDLVRHSKSEKHRSALAQVSNTQSLDKHLKTPLAKQIKRAEIKLAALIASNNLPFSLMDSLQPLVADICPDSQIAQSLSCKRTKTTAVVKQSLGENYRRRLNSTLADPETFFSVIMDETTDRGSIKQCAFTVIFLNQNTKKLECHFFDMVETPSGTAADLTKTLKETFSKHGVGLENTVGFSSDTTNVMFGENHSVVKLLKNDFPDVVFVKCSCHMIHLVASKACLKLPRYLEGLVRNVGAHFSRSFGRQDRFREFQEFFQVEILKILTPSTTRWLSLKECVNRIICQYTALQHYFLQLAFEDPSKTLDDIVSTLDNSFTIIYLEFMSYTLGLLTDFDVMFQSEHPLLHKLKKFSGFKYELLEDRCGQRQ